MLPLEAACPSRPGCRVPAATPHSSWQVGPSWLSRRPPPAHVKHLTVRLTGDPHTCLSSCGRRGPSYGTASPQSSLVQSGSLSLGIPAAADLLTVPTVR